MIKCFEVCATIFGLIQGVLVMYNKRSNWIAYVIQMAFLIVFSAFNHLYGDVVNNSIYFVIGIIGFILWKNEDYHENQLVTSPDGVDNWINNLKS